MQKGRTITVVMQVEDPKASKVVWEAMRDGGTVGGCKILSIGNGDAFTERDEANELLNEVAEYLSRHHLGDPKAEALLDRIEA